jgi:Ankyrin repeats (3 copies)/Ankyrin repeats (many copies)
MGWIHQVDSPYYQSIDELAEHPPPLGATALYLAASCGFSWLAKRFIATQAEDVNALSDSDWGDRTPLHGAYRGHLAASGVLYNQGVEVKREMEDESRMARHEGHLEVMRLLLEHGADIDAQDRDDEAVLHLASEHGEVEVVQLLLQHNVKINAEGMAKWTPLHNASRFGHISATRLLLKYGADVNARGRYDNTALILASMSGHLEVVRLLLGHKADVHIQGELSHTACYWATQRGHHEITKLLLEHGAEGENEDRSK